MVEMQSSKLATKARFPSPAPLLTLTIRFGGVIGAGGKLKTSNLKHGGLNFEIGTLQYPPVVQATPHPHSDNPLCARCRSFCAWNLALGTGNFASLACPFLPVTTHLVPRTINLVNGAGDLALRTPDLAVWAPALHAFSASDFPRPSDRRGCGKAGEALDGSRKYAPGHFQLSTDQDPRLSCSAIAMARTKSNGTKDSAAEQRMKEE